MLVVCTEWLYLFSILVFVSLLGAPVETLLVVAFLLGAPVGDPLGMPQ